MRARVVVLATGTELTRLLPGVGRDRGTLASVRASSRHRESVHLVLPRRRLRSSTGLVLRGGEHASTWCPGDRHWIVGSDRGLVGARPDSWPS